MPVLWSAKRVQTVSSLDGELDYIIPVSACTLCFLQFLVLFCSYILTFLLPFLGFYFCFLFCVSHLTYQVVSAPLVMEFCVATFTEATKTTLAF